MKQGSLFEPEPEPQPEKQRGRAGLTPVKPRPKPRATVVSLTKGDRIQAAFERFHRTHPEVYPILVKFTRDAKYQGQRKHYGISAVFERARWYAQIEKTEDFKLNNNYRAPYARLIMAQESDLEGFFSVRDSPRLARQKNVG